VNKLNERKRVSSRDDHNHRDIAKNNPATTDSVTSGSDNLQQIRWIRLDAVVNAVSSGLFTIASNQEDKTRGEVKNHLFSSFVCLLKTTGVIQYLQKLSDPEPHTSPTQIHSEREPIQQPDAELQSEVLDQELESEREVFKGEPELET